MNLFNFKNYLKKNKIEKMADENPISDESKESSGIDLTGVDILGAIMDQLGDSFNPGSITVDIPIISLEKVPNPPSEEEEEDDEESSGNNLIFIIILLVLIVLIAYFATKSR